MKKSLLAAYLFIVAVPLACVVWLGWHSIISEQQRYQDRLRQLQEERLGEFSDNQARWLDSLEADIIQFLEQAQAAPFFQWPVLQDRNRFARQLFSVDPAGTLAWPSEGVMTLTRDELAFRDLFEEGTLSLSRVNDETGQPGAYLNWSTWFEGQGEQWAAWIQQPGGAITGLILDRTTFMSEAIAQLPDRTGSSTSVYRTRLAPLNANYSDQFSLLDETGKVLYSWGAILPESEYVSTVEARLPAPLNMWKFQLASLELQSLPFYSQPLVLFMAIGIAALFLVTLSAAYYLYAATMREFRLARQRVSFVNQVSHEFKTPLTNIRIYSDLLEDDLPDGHNNRQLGIIREECAKLNRMIQNVLTFGRSQRAALQLNPSTFVPDELIAEQLDIHQPGLERMRIALEFAPDAGRPMRLDQECLSQILGNLLSNAEKYAPGSALTVRTRQSDGRLFVVVQDSGPGIPAAQHESVFEPFTRLKSGTSEGVSGTGIGLSIARELARLHGGDLLLEPTQTGARFVMNLAEAS